MKAANHGLLFLCCILATSCVPITEKQNLADGFYLKTTSYFPEPGRITRLFYKGKSGEKAVWNYVSKTAVHGDVAVFVGSWDGNAEYAGDCYFAAKGGGPVVRLRRAILERSATAHGARLDSYLTRYGDMALQEIPGGVRFRYAPRFGINDPDKSNPNNPTDVEWSAISDMIDRLLKTGKAHKDKLNRLTYLE